MAELNQENTLVKQEILPEKIEEEHPLKQQAGENHDSKQFSINHSLSEDSLLRNKVDLGDSIVGNEQIEQAEEVQQTKTIAADFYYPPDHKEQVHQNSPIPQQIAQLSKVFGQDTFKKYNLRILDKDTILYAAGISYTIYNHSTRASKTLYSRDRGGIGSIDVHPSKKYFAVAQQGTYPNIYIYEYPSLRLYRILRKGTQKSYSCICFSGSGQQLASIGSHPDYLLTVWEWKNQQSMLKSKAFSQEVYRVSFSLFNEKWLTTSGTGHIRFWKIAETFTGLKLQGDIGKFGQFQISDVVSYAEFEDGNVLSSSEYGNLLLWEGNMIKSVVAIDENTRCHKGAIEFVRLQAGKVISAGADGYIRFWDYEAINFGESDQKFNLYVKPERQIYFESISNTPAYLIWIAIQNFYWIVQDALGIIWKYNPQNDEREQLLKSSAGKFTGLAMSPLTNCCVTTGYDGFVRLWDYANNRQFYNAHFATHSESTCIQWLPFSKRNNGQMLAIGFSDGILRLVGLGSSKFTLIKALKVHRNLITKVKSNRQGNVIVVVDSLGSIFLLALDNFNLDHVTPYCLFQTGFKINDVCWDRTGDKILIACHDGRLHEIQVPKATQCSFQESYLREFESRSLTLKMMESQKPNKEDLQLQLLLKKTKGEDVTGIVIDQEWDPSPILNACYYDNDCTKVLCSAEGNFLGYHYIVDFKKERPIGYIEAPKVKTSYLYWQQSNDLIFVGYRNGSWQLRHKINPNNYLRKHSFDQRYGVVRNVSINIDNSTLICISQDGTMLSYNLDFQAFLKGAKGQFVQDVQISIPSVVLGISETTFSDDLDYGKQKEVDITDSSIYCLQDEKLKAEEDLKMTEAKNIKAKKIDKIKELQAAFLQILEQNNRQTNQLIKLTSDELLLDPAYTAECQRNAELEEEETKKELMWDEEKAALGRKKLQKHYIEELEFDKFKVKGLDCDLVVSSFKVKKLSRFIECELEEIQKIVKEEKQLALHEPKDRNISQFVTRNSNKFRDTRTSKEDNSEVKNKIREAEAEFQKELAYANATKGDYKLKCSPEYSVPQNERLNVNRKKKHLFLHYQYLHLQKIKFNSKLNGLRLRKQQFINQLTNINARLRQINSNLGVEEPDIIFQIAEEIQLIETDIQISEDDIIEYAAQKQREKNSAKKTGGMGMGSAEPIQDPQQKQKKPKKPNAPEKRQEKKLEIKPRQNAKTKKSKIQQELREIEVIKLSAQKREILDKLKQSVRDFDQELRGLKSLKYHLQHDLSLIEMKLLTFMRQFLIFRDMESYDNQLMASLTSLAKERDNLESNFLALSAEVQQIQLTCLELRNKSDDEKRLLKEFVYPENDQIRERIIRYYKVKQRKRNIKAKKAEMEKEQNSDESDSEQEQSDEESEDEFQDEDEKPDITVVQNDAKNFERVRKICEYDEKIEESLRKKSELERQRNQITNKIKNITNELAKWQKQLKVYQKSKLLKANQLSISIPVKYSQIEYVVELNGKARLYEQFNNCILFTQGLFKGLGQRIQELKREKIDIEKKQKKLSKKLTRLSEEVSKASAEIQSKRKEHQEKQLLKFGSTFQIEKLKELEPSTQVLQMRETYKKEERVVNQKIEKIKQELQLRKKQLLEAKRQNTKVITQITELGNRENDLKKKLDSTNKQLFKNRDVSKKDELEKERQNLKDLIKFLQKEIDDLKTEIGLFKRKGGHIYTMVTSNRRAFS